MHFISLFALALSAPGFTSTGNDLILGTISEAVVKRCQGALDPNETRRNKLFEAAVQGGIPAAWVKLNGVWVPVVLITTINGVFNRDLTTTLIQNTFSIGQELFPLSQTDHGHARVSISSFKGLGVGTDLNVDLYRPSIPHTGIRRNLGQGYRFAHHFDEVQADKGKARRHVEVAFHLDREKMFWIEAWQALKIADLIRIPSVYITNNAHFSAHSYNTRPYTLPDFCAEHCHNGRIAGKISEQISALESQMIKIFNMSSFGFGDRYLNVFDDLLTELANVELQSYKNDFFYLTALRKFPEFLSEVRSRIKWSGEHNVINQFLG